MPGDAQVTVCPPDIREKEPTGKPLLHSYKYSPSPGRPLEVRKRRRAPNLGRCDDVLVASGPAP